MYAVHSRPSFVQHFSDRVPNYLYPDEAEMHVSLVECFRSRKTVPSTWFGQVTCISKTACLYRIYPLSGLYAYRSG